MDPEFDIEDFCASFGPNYDIGPMTKKE